MARAESHSSAWGEGDSGGEGSENGAAGGDGE